MKNLITIPYEFLKNYGRSLTYLMWISAVVIQLTSPSDDKCEEVHYHEIVTNNYYCDSLTRLANLPKEFDHGTDD